MKSEHCQSREPKKHWRCEQGGCDCRCHETTIYDMENGTVTTKRVVRNTRRRSERGNWLVVTYRDGEIWWCSWVQTWGGVQASKRNAEKDLKKQDRVIVVDLERAVDLAATEGANEISDLERLLKL